MLTSIFPSVPIRPISLPNIIRGFPAFPKEKTPRIHESGSGILEAVASGSRWRMNRGFARVFADWRNAGHRLFRLPSYSRTQSFRGNRSFFIQGMRYLLSKSVSISPISLPYFIRGFPAFPEENEPRITRIYADWLNDGRRLFRLPSYNCT
jgi:hypothetical protein